MNNIIFTKGPPGSGKSTFLRERGLEPYTIATDQLRLLYSSPQLNLSGNLEISPNYDKKVWHELFVILEDRMKKGDFLVVDATHTKAGDFKKYKDLVDNYRYRAWCLDFSDTPLAECLERNQQRQGFKIVADEVVISMHQRAQDSTIPAWITSIDKQGFDEWLSPEPKDLSHYKRIHHIGDVQGCFTVLQEYFAANPLKDDELFILVGDYIDRGIENAQVVNFLLDLLETKPNCIFLEGNHDKYLWQWANNLPVKTQEFNDNTKPQLDEANVDKARVRNFCRHLKKYFHYRYQDKLIVVTHGGISNWPRSFKLISTGQFIHGIGVYGDSTKCDQAFNANVPENAYSIHGHRNVDRVPTQTGRCFNLEGRVEYGENLRAVILAETGFELVELTNSVFNQNLNTAVEIEVPFRNDNFEIINKLRENKLIIERTFPHHISSFNFKKEAFFKKIWNEQTVKARGLFINNNNYEVVARSYEKFFNIGEMDFTEFEYLHANFQYPVEVYRKENGYLGIIGYNSEFDELVFTSKSSTENDYVFWFKQIFKQHHEPRLEELKKLLRDENISLVFEVIDPHNDPHIVEYENRSIVLLDVVSRKLVFEKKSYEYAAKLAAEFGFTLKGIETTFNSAAEFTSFYMENTQRSHLISSHEGFVFEDSAGLMVKLKLPYYNFWKYIRDYLENYRENRQTRVRKELLENPVFTQFMEWLNAKEESYLQKSIIELRKLFLQEAKLI